MRVKLTVAGCGVTFALMASVASAHVSISPNQSMAGATEKYTVRVPTESKVATVGAEVDIPEGVVFEVVSVPNGWKYELKRDASNRVTGIVWTMNIPPGEFAVAIGVAGKATILLLVGHSRNRATTDRRLCAPLPDRCVAVMRDAAW